MELNEYQRLSLVSEQRSGQQGLIIALLGLAGEAGELLSAYKKFLRDGQSNVHYLSSVKEELGDLLWYLSNVASKFDLSLSDIATSNLRKIKSRWLSDSDYEDKGFRASQFYDTFYPKEEQLPRLFTVKIVNEKVNDRNRARTLVADKQVGDYLTDNSYSNDGYRFHDVFHLSYVAILGWSPVFRKNNNCKRRSNALVNEVEDGGRATVIEEGISALVFAYAKDHNWLEEITTIDDSLLSTIMKMVDHLEVKDRLAAEWERAILMGFEVFREVVKNSGGEITVDMNKGEIKYLTLLKQ